MIFGHFAWKNVRAAATAATPKNGQLMREFFCHSFFLCSSPIFLFLILLHCRFAARAGFFFITRSSFHLIFRRLHFCFTFQLFTTFACAYWWFYPYKLYNNKFNRIIKSNRDRWCVYIYGSRCHHLSILYMDDVRACVYNIVVIAWITGPHKRVNTCTCHKVNRFELYTFTNIFDTLSSACQPASQPKTKNQNRNFLLVWVFLALATTTTPYWTEHTPSICEHGSVNAEENIIRFFYAHTHTHIILESWTKWSRKIVSYSFFHALWTIFQSTSIWIQ